MPECLPVASRSPATLPLVACRWGVGCVFFEIVSLFPLFPGTNELDQIQKIHNILGTPPPELLAKMKKRSQRMDFNFLPKEGTGISKVRRVWEVWMV